MKNCSVIRILKLDTIQKMMKKKNQSADLMFVLFA